MKETTNARLLFPVSVQFTRRGLLRKRFSICAYLSYATLLIHLCRGQLTYSAVYAKPALLAVPPLKAPGSLFVFWSLGALRSELCSSLWPDTPTAEVAGRRSS